MNRIIFLIIILLLTGVNASAQYQVVGYVIDSENQMAVSLVHVFMDGETNGSVTDETGYFEIITNQTRGILTFQALGFKPKSIQYKVTDSIETVGEVYIERTSISLDEITISAGLVSNESTPITVSRLSAKTIHNELGDRPLPLTLNNTPGVYAVRNGGGSGDAEMSIRGFNQENVGVLLNGVPINGVENGLVYWSNWLGLSNAAAEIQIQKGPGFSNAAINSVGGSINIISEPASKNKGGSIWYQITNYGNQKLTISLNSGKLKSGWSISLLGSYTQGSGYIDATYVRGWSYYLALSKQLNKRNKFTLTLLGAPQRHGQRTLKLSNEEHALRGNLFNKDWGSYNGQINNASENFYHRPFLGLNHYLSIDENKKIATSVYVILGNGGGKWSESFNYSPTIFQYRNPSGQIDWSEIYNINYNNEDQYQLANGDTVSGYSMNVQTHFLASHVEAGVLSTYEQQLSRHLKLVAGIHYRYFNSYLREQIVDLLGGDFFVEDYGWAVDGVAGRNQIMTVGDIIKVDNNSVINFMNAYAQLLWEKDPINAYISVNGNNNWHQRVDRYNYVNNSKSDLIIKPGFDIRGGISYKPTIQHNIYANAAIISKAPLFKFVFGSFTNEPTQNLENEKIGTVEIGYKFENKTITTNINAFYTSWNNVSMLTDEYVQLENNRQSRAMINGLNALHQGIEAEIKARINPNFGFSGFLVLADYKWKNNVTAELYNNDNVVVDTVNVFVENLYVGGTAQQQFGLSTDFRFLKTFNIRAEWVYYDKIYSNFSPTNRRNPEDISQPYQIPAYHSINLYIGVPFNFFKSAGLLQINAYNILNDVHIEWGEDGLNHDLDTFSGFWSFGRTFDFMLKLNL